MRERLLVLILALADAQTPSEHDRSYEAARQAADALAVRLKQAEAAAELVVSQRGKGSYVSISREAYDACDAFLASIPKEACEACHATGVGGPDGEKCVSCGGTGLVASIPKEET